MHTELSAAVAYLRSLIEQSETCKWSKSQDAMDVFSHHLYPALATRCSVSSWNEQDPEIGSADRVIHWQVQPGGEGADEDVLEACWRAMERFTGKASGRSTENKETLVLETLPTSFTLWIDSGCVAVRLGPGPGLTSVSSLKINVNESDHSNGSINVVWGTLPLVAATVKSSRPNVTLSSEVSSSALSSFSTSSSSGSSRMALGHRPRAIAIVDPASQAYLGLGRPPYAPSPLSACSTSSGSSLWSATSADSILSRSSSLSSASSLSSSEGGWSPLLMESSLKDKEPDFEAGKQDQTPQCDQSIGEETVGDITIQAGEEAAEPALRAAPSSDTLVTSSPAPQKKSLQSTPSTSVTSSVTSNKQMSAEERRISNARPDAPTRIVPAPAAGIKEARLYDNGKVGVLGGGVKLGSNENRQARNNHGHSHSQSHSKSHSQQANTRTAFGRSSAANSQANYQQQFQPKQNLHHLHQRASYSAPTQTISLPQVGQQAYSHHHLQQQHQRHLQQEQQNREIALHNHLHNLSVEHQQRVETRGDGFPTLPIPHGFNVLNQNQNQNHGQPPMSASSSYSSNLSSASSECNSSVSGNEYGSGYSSADSRRSRTRGRRSRGRGAGRAQRRQAAAMKALEESEAKCLDLDLDDFDFEDDEVEGDDNQLSGQSWSGSTSNAFFSSNSLIYSSPASSAGELLYSDGSLNSTPSSCCSQTVPLPFSSPNDFDRLTQSSANGFVASQMIHQSSNKLQDLTHSSFANQGLYHHQANVQSSCYNKDVALSGNHGMSLGLDLGLEQAWDGASEMTPRATFVGTF